MPIDIGSRVRIAPSEAEGYAQPYRKLIQEGRAATVTHVHQPERGRQQNLMAGQCRIVFDVKRKGVEPQVLMIRVKDLEEIEDLHPEEGPSP